MAAHEDAEARTRGPAGLLGQLQVQARDADGVVRGDDARLSLAEELIEIDVPEGHKGRGRLGGRVGEGGVVVGHEARTHIGVRGGGRGDARQAQLIDEPILQGAVEPFASAPGRGGVGADVLDPEAGQGPPDVGQALGVNRGPRGGGMEGPAGAVGLQGGAQAVGAEDHGQGREDGVGGLGGPELGVEQALGGIVEDGQQDQAQLGAQGQPGVGAAVQMEQLAEAGAGRRRRRSNSPS